MNNLAIKSYYFFIGAILCTAPFFILVNSWMIILLVTIWLFVNRPHQKWNLLVQNYLLLLPFLAYFLAQIYGLLISENISVAGFNLEQKMAIIIIPLVIATGPQLSSKTIHKLFSWYSYTLFVAIVLMLSLAAINYTNNGNLDVFYYHDFSNLLNPDIHAVYLSISISVALFFLMHKHRKLELTTMFILDSLIGLTMLVVIVLLSSKTVLIGLIMILVALIVLATLRNNNRKPAILLTSILLVGLITLLNTRAYERYHEIYDSNLEVLNQKDFNYNSQFNGFTLRLVLWNEAWRTLKEENAMLSGVGSGDFEKELFLRYKERNLYMDVDKPNPVGYQNYNPHNQYLQEWLKNGLFGLFALLSMLVIVLKTNSNAPLYFIGFFSLMTLLMITESALERQHGLISFALIAAISLFQNKVD
jgi:O-antigen ligase